MVVQHNIPAINANRQLGINNSSLSKSLEKLSSGFKINRAADNAAGLAISEKMRGQINGLTQASTNAQDGISLIQTAEGALEETHSILQRMRELAVQSSNGTYQNDVDRENIEKEVTALKDEIDRISTSTHYNNIKLLDGSLQGAEVAATNYIATGGNINATAGANTHAELAITFTAAPTTGTADEIKAGTKALAVAQDKLIAAMKDTGVTVSTDNTPAATLTLDGYNIATNGDVTATGSIEVIAKIATGGTLTADKTDVIKTDDISAIASGVSAAKGALTLQIGANGSADQKVSLSVEDMSSEGIGVDTISVATRADANSAIDVIDSAINQVSGTRANLGALQNRMEHTIKSLDVSNENLTAAESRIRDVDMAKEMMQFTKNQILAQASQSMLAQANQLPQGVLQLLQ